MLCYSGERYRAIMALLLTNLWGSLHFLNTTSSHDIAILQISCESIVDIEPHNEENIKNCYTFSGGNSVKIILSPFWNKSTLKGKNLLPIGSKFFPFKVDLFSEGAQDIKKVISFTKERQKIYQVYPVPLMKTNNTMGRFSRWQTDDVFVIFPRK